jgi:hypothetical protein
VSLSLAEYAAAKRLPEEFLREFGLRNDDWFGTPAIAVPTSTRMAPRSPSATGSP